MTSPEESKSLDDEQADVEANEEGLPGEFWERMESSTGLFRESLREELTGAWRVSLSQAKDWLPELVDLSSVIALVRLLNQRGFSQVRVPDFWGSDVPVPREQLRAAVSTLLRNLADELGKFEAGNTHDDWTDRKNARRCDLIDKQIEGEITEDERRELAELQEEMRRDLDKVAPFPMDGARRLHAELMRKKRESHGQD